MANKKIFNVRLQNRYDTYEAFIAADPVLLNGEIVAVSVAADDNQTQSPPAIMLKCGMDNKKFSELPWISGLSANSYAWSLAPTKPVYDAQEIVNLQDFISEAVDDKNTQYRIVPDEADASKLYLQSSDNATAEEPTWTTVSTFNSTKVEAGTTAGTIKVNGIDVAITGWTALQTQVTTNTEAITTLNGADTVEGSVANTVKTAVDTLENTLNEKIEAQISSAYHPAGSIAPDALVSDLLVAGNSGKVYNITGEFTTTNDFVEGEGRKYPLGTNVVIINAGTEEAPVYKFDVLAGFVDLQDYATFEEVDSAVADAIKGLTADQLPNITTDKITDFTTSVETVVKEQLTAPAEGEEKPELLTQVENIATEKVTDAINALDVTDVAVADEYVTQVVQEDGRISVSRAKVNIAGLEQTEGDYIVLASGGASGFTT